MVSKISRRNSSRTEWIDIWGCVNQVDSEWQARHTPLGKRKINRIKNKTKQQKIFTLPVVFCTNYMTQFRFYGHQLILLPSRVYCLHFSKLFKQHFLSFWKYLELVPMHAAFVYLSIQNTLYFYLQFKCLYCLIIDPYSHTKFS